MAIKKTPPVAESVPEAGVSPAVGRNIGRTTKMRVMQYQDHTMAQQLKAKLTDEELAENWSTEFPDARCVFRDRVSIVAVVRRLFNEHRHGAQKIFSDQPIPKFEIQNGKRVAVEEPARSRGAARQSAQAKVVEATAPAPKVPVVAPKTVLKKTVLKKAS